MIRPLAVVVTILLAASPALAAVVTVPDTSDEFAGLAVVTASLLIDDGLPLKKTGDDTYAVEARDIHCDFNSRAMLDTSNPTAGLPSGSCRINSENQRNTTKGELFSNTHALNDLLQDIQSRQTDKGVHLVDCAMGGYCGTFVKFIRCTVNTSVKTLDGGGRWTCLFGDSERNERLK